jgi:Holliday junction resolvase RusA-like endonuclease
MSPTTNDAHLIVDFYVPMRPVPWSVPMVLRTGRSIKSKRLLSWQKAVATCCRMAMGRTEPYAGPVRLDFEFHLTKRAGSLPDTSNLTKAAEDALQGVAIVNDRAVWGITSRRVVGDGDGARVRVYAEVQS